MDRNVGKGSNNFFLIIDQKKNRLLLDKQIVFIISITVPEVNSLSFEVRLFSNYLPDTDS